MPRANHVITVRLSAQEYEALQHAKEERGLQLSTCARWFIREGLKQQGPAAQARVLIEAIEKDVDLRHALRRLVLWDSD